MRVVGHLALSPQNVGGGTPFFTALDNWVNLTLWRPGRFPTAWF